MVSVRSRAQTNTRRSDLEIHTILQPQNSPIAMAKSSSNPTSSGLSFLHLVAGPFAILLAAIPLLIFFVNTDEQAIDNIMPELAAATPATHAFSLLVSLKFTEEKHKETFLEDFAPLAAYVKEKEVDTIAYEVLLSDKDPLCVLIMERYKDKEEAYLQVHKTSEPFLEFRPKLQALQDAGFVTVDGESYIDSGLGFVGDRT